MTEWRTMIEQRVEPERTVAALTLENERLREEITVDEQRVADLMGDVQRQDRKIETLRDLLLEIWRHRNGGSALSTCWDRRVTEVLEDNGPA